MSNDNDNDKDPKIIKGPWLDEKPINSRSHQ